jgi:CPA1 family monovalent cation:H+ antiporter
VAGSSITTLAGFPEYVIPVFLGTVFAAALLSSRTKVPYTMMLVAIGIAISFSGLSGFHPLGKGFSIDPRLIIDFIIPPLIFEAMMKVKFEEFRKVRVSSLLLSTLGVVLAVLVGGYLLMIVAGLPPYVAFAFAALISPTDAAMVIEVFKRVKVPGPLAALMDSEATFNDATGVIAFSSVLALAAGSGSALTGGPTSINTGGLGSLALGQVEHFAVVFLGGAGIGLAVAAGTHRLHRLTDDPFSETALTVATLFGSVVLANALGVSGLIAAAVAGLYFGNVTIRREGVVSERVRDSAFNFWEMIAFFANSAAFLYLGLTMDLFKVSQNLPLIGLAFAAVIGARAASTYPILAMTSRIGEKIPANWRNVVFLGGMRGALSVALAASLPDSDFKSLIQTLTFGVVLSSLIIQYLVLSAYVRRSFSILVRP